MIAVVPLAGTWIETFIAVSVVTVFPSFPLRERGLKLLCMKALLSEPLSFPLRERGLKQALYRQLLPVIQVVPLAGTWIETSNSALQQ